MLSEFKTLNIKMFNEYGWKTIISNWNNWKC